MRLLNITPSTLGRSSDWAALGAESHVSGPCILRHQMSPQGPGGGGGGGVTRCGAKHLGGSTGRAGLGLPKGSPRVFPRLFSSLDVNGFLPTNNLLPNTDKPINRTVNTHLGGCEGGWGCVLLSQGLTRVTTGLDTHVAIVDPIACNRTLVEDHGSISIFGIFPISTCRVCPQETHGTHFTVGKDGQTPEDFDHKTGLMSVCYDQSAGTILESHATSFMLFTAIFSPSNVSSYTGQKDRRTTTHRRGSKKVARKRNVQRGRERRKRPEGERGGGDG